MKTNITSNARALLRALFTPLLVLAALFAAPAAARAQTFYVSNGSQTIQKVSSTGAVSLFATLPSGSNPYGLAFDVSGNLYVAESNANQIGKITPGGVVSTFVNGLGLPIGLAFDTSGNLYEMDFGTVKKITSGGVVTTFATLPSGSSFGGLAFDASGNLYAADTSIDQISKISSGGAVSIFATLSGGSAPFGLAFDTGGNLYVGNRNATSQISKITSGGVVSTFATLPPNSFPGGLTFDGSGSLYTADFNTSQISMITPSGAVSTFATGILSPEFIVLAPTPEPTSAVLLLGGGALLATRRRRSRSAWGR